MYLSLAQRVYFQFLLTPRFSFGGTISDPSSSWTSLLTEAVSCLLSSTYSVSHLKGHILFGKFHVVSRAVILPGNFFWKIALLILLLIEYLFPNQRSKGRGSTEIGGFGIFGHLALETPAPSSDTAGSWSLRIYFSSYNICKFSIKVNSEIKKCLDATNRRL